MSLVQRLLPEGNAAAAAVVWQCASSFESMSMPTKTNPGAGWGMSAAAAAAATPNSAPVSRPRSMFGLPTVLSELSPIALARRDAQKQGGVTVLLKALDEEGFVFFTNTESQKGRQLALCPRAAATFLWKASGVQVQLVGPISQVSDEAADAYFSTRDRGSQIGAWASHQSSPLDSREALMQRVSDLEAQYDGVEVPRPPYWTGFVLSPESVEFWTPASFVFPNHRTSSNPQFSFVKYNPTFGKPGPAHG